jgi:ferrochelatase
VTPKEARTVSEHVAVLLMAYGSPNSLEDVGPYYRSIRGGRTPTAEEVDDLTDRYRRVGGHTGLTEITHRIASALEERLWSVGDATYSVHVGMKHWHPFIPESVRRIADEGASRLIALPLAPHYSEMSTGQYFSAVEDGLKELPTPLLVRYVESWHRNPLYVGAMAGKVQSALGTATSDDVAVVFSAHSLPRKILQADDPYPRELHDSCEAVAAAAGLGSWRFAYQSASHTGQPWLGPDILETLSDLASQGRKRVLVVPIGFVTDNLEILFDLDVEARQLADGLGFRLDRTEMLNDSPVFIGALADVVLNGTGTRSRYAGAALSGPV